MSDEALVVPSPVTGEVTAGTLLRQAREASGLHVAALAVSMKVPVKKLEALEADRLEELPDAVFIRALAASVCRTLKVDPAPILGRLPQSVTPKLNSSDRGVSMPTQGSNFLASHSVADFATRPTVLLVAALLLAALAVVFVPEARNSVGLAQSGKLVPPAEPLAPPMAPPVAKDVAVAVNPVPVAKPLAEIPQPQASAQAAAVLAAPAEPAPGPATVAAKPASAAVAAGPDAGAATSGLLVFKARSRAWVRVSDSQGVVQFEKTLASGESAAASGALPLSVIVGNVAATDVVLRGQPFPLVGVTQNNVARFEVK